MRDIVRLEDIWEKTGIPVIVYVFIHCSYSGNWVVYKTTNRFSAIPIDQAHENNNCTVKGVGGAIGLTENPSAFRKWMLSGAEQARILREFEDSFPDESKVRCHHEEGLSTQQTFRKQVAELSKTISDL